MMPDRRITGLKGPPPSDSDRSWSDLQALARRVIRAANLAVMTHAELDVLTSREPADRSPVEKGVE